MPRRLLTGGLLLLAGAALLLWALVPERETWTIEKTPLPIPPGLVSHYPPEGFERWEVEQKKTGRRLTFHVIHYRDAGGRKRQAILPQPGSAAWRAWMELAESLRQRKERDALILTWWDNAQRIDFLTGIPVWTRRPPAEAFTENQRDLWRQLSGGFGDSQGHLKRLAGWLSRTDEQLPKAIEEALSGRSIHLLISTDDLSHVNEFERLTGRKLPLDVRIFPSTGNLHGQISAVQAWAQETGGIYLPQAIPGGIAAWRMQRPKSSVPLWLRLLPFTYPAPPSMTTLKLVYHSSGGQLNLYRLFSGEHDPPPK